MAGKREEKMREEQGCKKFQEGSYDATFGNRYIPVLC